jgi:hypothetical protein
MNASEEQLIASDLRELLGNKRAPDLIDRTLARLRESKAVPAKEEATLHALPSWRWQRFALAASVLLALGLIGWLAWPRALPEGVSATGSASYAVRADFIELREGALLLQTGAPEVRAGQARVSGVKGRSVVRAGGIPEDFAALDELPLTDKEKPMLKEIKRWSVATGVALCVLSGSALLNDKLIEAKDDAPAPEKIESPKPEDTKGVRAALEKTTSVTVRGRDASFRMCCPVEITNAIEVKELVDAIYSDLELAEAPAGWSSANQITFHLSDGREIEILVNIKGGLADLRMAGWKRYYEYNVRADLLQRFLRPIDRSIANGPDCPHSVHLRKLRGFSGADSAIRTKEIVAARSFDELADLWRRHAPGKAVPDVDFASEWVLGVFQGQGVNSRGVELVEILEQQGGDGQRHVLRYDDSSYQTSGGANEVTAYGIFVLNNIDDLISVEENVQSLKGQPPLWATVGKTGGLVTPRYPREATVSALRSWEGEGSALKDKLSVLQATRLITSKDDWEKMWAEHKPDEAAPEVDFENEQVACIFQTVPAGWGGVKITELLASSARVVLRVRGTGYQSKGEPPRLYSAYGFHVFRKGLKLSLESPKYETLDSPPRWQETAWK